VLELERRFPAAAAAAAQATRAEPTDWRTWLVRSRIDAERGAPAAALAAYRRARSLDPRSPVFTG
jgi:cytochrome c-type biogenesis protein CcmH/NrfG